MAISFATRVAGSFDSAVEAVEKALGEEGFGILSRIDVQATLKAKLDLDIAPYLILGACNPPLASNAIAAVPSIGVLLPCNVVVRGGDDGPIVEFMDPEAVLSLIESDEIADIATDVRARLQRVKDAVAG
jgi:uncharacterized protein (DUF302 family)